MKNVNPELTDKIAVEVARKTLIDDAKDLVERRRPVTRAAIEEFETTKRLNDSFNNYLEC